MDNDEFEELPVDNGSSSGGIDSSSFSSGDTLASPTTPTSSDDSGSLHDRMQSGREEFAKTLDNKNYYDDKLKENEKEKGKLDNEKKELEKDNKEKSDALKDKDNALKDSQNKLNDAKNNFKNGGGILNKKGEQSSLKDRAANKIRENKEKRNNIKQNKNNVKDAKNQRDQAEKDKKESDNKLKDNENSLKKNELERKKLEKDKSKAEKFAKKHPLEALKMKAGHALKKLRNLIIIKVLIPLLLILVCVAFFLEFAYEIFQAVDNAITTVANVQEKFDNFTNGLGFQNSEEAFYDDLEAQQKEYDNEINVPLLLSTLFYDDIQNNMDPSEVGAEVVTGEESLISFAAVFDYVKSKVKESNETVGKDGYRYSSNKIYRMRMLAKNMVTKTGSKHCSLSEYWDRITSRIGDAFLNMIDITNVLQIVFSPADFLESVYQVLVEDEVFEATDFGNFLHDNIITDIFDFLGAIFDAVFDIESISIDGVTYSSHKYDENAYFKYLKEEYIPRMPEFKKYIQGDNEEIVNEQIDKVIKEIKDIYKNYQEYFMLPDADAEQLNNGNGGSIDPMLVRQLRIPVDTTGIKSFDGRDAFGIYNGTMHNGVTLTHTNSGINVGDNVYAVAKGQIIGMGRSDGTSSGDTTGMGNVFPKYTLSDSELRAIASQCIAEQGSYGINAVKAEASLMANLYEIKGSSYKNVYEYVKNGGWFHKSQCHMDPNYKNNSNCQKDNGDWWAYVNPSEVQLEAIKDVLVNGNRTLPKYVDEHDSVYDIDYIETDGKKYTSRDDIKNPNNYVKGKTTIHFKATYTFYEFPDPGSDPFGYTPSSYSKYGNEMESDCNWIKIEHNIVTGGKSFKFYTIYKYLGSIADGLEVGKFVDKEQVIGTVGTVKDYTEASLYFEFRDENNTPINPNNLFIPPDSELVGDNLAERIWWALRDAGLSEEATAGLLGNISSETGGGDIDAIKTNSIEGVNSYEAVMNSGYGFGLCGWTHSSFKEAFRDYLAHVGGNWNDEKVQIGFLIETILATDQKSSNSWERKLWYDKGSYTMKNFLNAPTPEVAALNFCEFYERPAAGCGDFHDDNGKPYQNPRLREARKIYERLKGKSKPASAVATKANSSSGFIWPLRDCANCYHISSFYGWRGDIGIEGATKDHKGIDIDVPCGTPVYAVADGVVIYTHPSSDGDRGINLIVNHEYNGASKNGDLCTRYQHLSKILVSNGQHVSQGQEIAESGNTGVGNCHLHFEVSKYPNYYRQDESDPFNYYGIPPKTVNVKSYVQ